MQLVETIMENVRPYKKRGSAQRRKRKHPREDVVRADKQTQALALRRQGLSYKEIATAMGLRQGRSAWLHVHNGMRAMLIEPAEAVRNLERARYDALQAAYWEKALDGDIGAATLILKVFTRRAALEGLDAPTKTALTSPDGSKDHLEDALANNDQAHIEATLQAQQAFLLQMMLAAKQSGITDDDHSLSSSAADESSSH
jgi:DNA-binding phage protein